MTTFLLILWLVTSIALVVFYFFKRRADAAAKLERPEMIENIRALDALYDTLRTN